jgi:GalNAc-alpha-(1->4)-GalNAc-alpha-(1->3)-diNAcBac-PP-undecaprenol alpha-1,4-N-acetyl-D-galactosaminyltransferase
MKILFFISSFQSGGAERVASILLDRWRREGWEIVVAQWSLKDPFYALDPSICFRRLGLNDQPRSILDRLLAPFRRLSTVRQTIREESPDLVVSFMTRQNVYACLASRGLGIPLIVSEHSLRSVPLVSRGLDAVRALVYPWADRVVLLTKSDLAAYSSLQNASVIPNPVDLPPASVRGARKPYILAVGRLSREKGMDLLVSAFSRITERHGFVLRIAGEGDERTRLEARIRELGLQADVELLGRRNDIYSLYEEASFLVLPSRYEGFGMVLVEAMSFGCPVVAFDCPCGPAEIIRDDIDGLLVPNGDVTALAAAMERMMSDEALRLRLGLAGPEVRQRFGIDKIAGMWDALFTKVLAAPKKE